jgi:PAS domain S-box-containing protein
MTNDNLFPKKTKRPKNKWLIALAGLPVGLAFAALIWLHYGAFSEAKNYSYWVHHTDDAIILTKELHTSLIEAEAEQRGFVITGENKFSEKYYKEKKNVEAGFQKLHQFFANNSAQQSKVDALEKISLDRFISLDNGIRYRQGNNLENARELLLNKKGEEDMDQFMATVASLTTDEEKALIEKEKAENSSTIISFRTLLIGDSINLVLVALLFVIIQREINKHARTSKELATSREFFSKTLESIGDAVISTDAKGNVNFMNFEAENLTGRILKEVAGKPIEFTCDIINEKTRLTVENPVTKALKGNRDVLLSNSTLILKKDKSFQYIDNCASPIRNDNGDVIGAVLVFRNVTRQKEKEMQLMQSRLQLEIFKKESLESLDYAQHLQKALMQNKNDLKELFFESFIFFLPKQIVSGDFFWFKKNKNRSLISVGDCTGHGIPGALLSVMGLNLLNAAFDSHAISSPPKLLNFLDEEINHKLSDKSNHKTINDGMDIVICEIDHTEMMLNISGANQSVYLVSEGELHQFKTDKYNIGSAQKGKQFSSQSIPLKKGDMLFLSSDGYPDQFGGEKGKKFSYARFRELLLSISEEKTVEQKNILKYSLSEWQGTQEQTDDIAVMGIRI